MDPIQNVLNLLDELDITYTLLRHGKVHTVEECAAVDAAIGGKHCKNLFLTTRNGDALFLVLISAEKKYVTSSVSKQLGVSRLSFCTPETMKEVLDLTPGSVNPFALLNDKKGRVTLAIDRDLKGDDVCFHPNSNEATVKLNYSDFLKVLAYMGRTLLYIEA
jgi:Ala-tRNA(Pro) deacylase